MSATGSAARVDERAARPTESRNRLQEPARMKSTSNPKPWSRHALPWLLLMIVGALAVVLRYELIEPAAVVQLCESGHGPAWCGLRQWLVLGFLGNVYGIAALAAAALALAWRHAWIAWLAAAIGAFALELYCFEAGALALLIGCLRLLRIQAQLLPRMAPAH
jgi:hypothetical protein